MPPVVVSPAIDLPSFSGPLDLLLHLIERHELDITAISLAKVAQQYLQQLEALKERRVEPLLAFLLIGAQLALIKSRALLPKPPPIIAEQEETEDPAEALARRLRTYKRFKETAAWLHQREVAGWRTYLRLAPPPPKTAAPPTLDTRGLTAERLQATMRDILRRAAQRDDSVHLTQKPTITIEGQIARLRHATQTHARFPFGALFTTRPTRAELAVSLLAVLELIKRREINAHQAEPFGVIELMRREEEGA